MRHKVRYGSLLNMVVSYHPRCSVSLMDKTHLWPSLSLKLFPRVYVPRHTKYSEKPDNWVQLNPWRESLAGAECEWPQFLGEKVSLCPPDKYFIWDMPFHTVCLYLNLYGLCVLRWHLLYQILIYITFSWKINIIKLILGALVFLLPGGFIFFSTFTLLCLLLEFYWNFSVIYMSITMVETTKTHRKTVVI